VEVPGAQEFISEALMMGRGIAASPVEW